MTKNKKTYKYLRAMRLALLRSVRRISLEIDLAGFVFSPLDDWYEFNILPVKTDECAARSLIAVSYQKEMCFIIDILWIHLIWKV